MRVWVSLSPSVRPVTVRPPIMWFTSRPTSVPKAGAPTTTAVPRSGQPVDPGAQHRNGACGLHDPVDAAPAGEVLERPGQVGIGGVNRVGGAELLGQLQPGGRPGPRR